MTAAKSWPITCGMSQEPLRGGIRIADAKVGIDHVNAHRRIVQQHFGSLAQRVLACRRPRAADVASCSCAPTRASSSRAEKGLTR